MFSRFSFLRIGFIAFIIFVNNSGLASAQEQTLRAVYNALGGVMVPIWVAQDAGLFTKHGVDVDLKYLAATSAVQAMRRRRRAGWTRRKSRHRRKARGRGLDLHR